MDTRATERLDPTTRAALNDRAVAAASKAAGAELTRLGMAARFSGVTKDQWLELVRATCRAYGQEWCVIERELERKENR